MTIHDSRLTVQRHWIELALIIAVCVPFIFWGLGSIDFLDPDEGMYGSIAREMAEGGDWVTPHFDGVRYLEKPPLYFWLTALTVYAIGPSEWAVRLWSAFPTLGTAILTWRLGTLLYGNSAGTLSAIILVSGVGVFRYARVAAADSLLLFSLTLSFYGFVLAYTYNARALIIFFLGMALGFLSKGLIGIVFPLLIVAVFIVGDWKWAESGSREGVSRARAYDLLANRHSLLGFLLFIAVAVPWHLLAAWKNPGFLQFYVIDNQFLRFFNMRSFTEDDISISTVRFLILTLVWFFPWSFFLLPGLPQGFPNLRFARSPVERVRLVVGFWALCIIGFFSLSASKLEHYFLPAIPPLSLMVGAAWSKVIRGQAQGDGSSVRSPIVGIKGCLWVSAVTCLLFGAGLLIYSGTVTSSTLFDGLAELNVYYRILKEQGFPFPFATVTPFVELLKGLSWVLLLGFPLSFVFYCFRLSRLSFGVLVGVAALTGALVFKLLLVIEPHHSAKAVSLALKERFVPGDIIVHEGPLEYSGSLPFYSGRQVYVLNGRRGDLDFGSRFEDSANMFLDDRRFTTLWESPTRVFLIVPYEEADKKLFALRREKLFLLGEFGSRRLYVNQRISNDHP